MMDLEAMEADARLERMDRVAVLYGEITAATREFLRAVAECDRHRDWAGPTPPAWVPRLRLVCRLARVAARRLAHDRF